MVGRTRYVIVLGGKVISTLLAEVAFGGADLTEAIRAPAYTGAVPYVVTYQATRPRTL